MGPERRADVQNAGPQVKGGKTARPCRGLEPAGDLWTRRYQHGHGDGLAGRLCGDAEFPGFNQECVQELVELDDAGGVEL